MKRVSVFDRDILHRLRAWTHDRKSLLPVGVESHGEEESSDLHPSATSELTVVEDYYTEKKKMRAYVCTTCDVSFGSLEMQREHFRSKTHVDRILGSREKSRSAEDKDPDKDSEKDLTDDKVQYDDGNEEYESTSSSVSVSSCSSESDEEDDDDEERMDGTFSIESNGWKVRLASCIIIDYVHKELPIATYWLVAMIVGGRFSAAFVRNGKIETHRTFHAYVSRHKRGGLQSSHDSKSCGGGGCRSIGSQIRRENETHFWEKVGSCLTEWLEEIRKVEVIFLHAPGRNKHRLFSIHSLPLLKGDQRIRRIPYSTHRPSFEEVKRVVQRMCSAQLMVIQK